MYIKNPTPTFFHNGAIKKQMEYVKINLQMMMERLLPDETYGVGYVYVGNQKFLFARLVLYRLTEKQLRGRRKKQVESEKKKGKSYSKKSKILSGINIYLTLPQLVALVVGVSKEVYQTQQKIKLILICVSHIHGSLKGYDAFSFLIKSSGKSQVVYKHAIATIQLEIDKK